MKSPNHQAEPTDLRFADHVLLWAMRAWVVGVLRNISTTALIQTALAKGGAPGAAPYLDCLMRTLALGASRKIHINCCCHPTVSPDERLVLDVLALHQSHRSFEAAILLRTIADPEGAIRAGEAADALAHRLLDVSLTLSLPASNTGRYIFFDRSSEGLPADTTLH